MSDPGDTYQRTHTRAQGHVRIGPDIVTEPAYHVSRNEEDFVTWRSDSKVRRAVATYQDKVDDAELV